MICSYNTYLIRKQWDHNQPKKKPKLPKEIRPVNETARNIHKILWKITDNGWSHLDPISFLPKYMQKYCLITNFFFICCLSVSHALLSDIWGFLEIFWENNNDLWPSEDQIRWSFVSWNYWIIGKVTHFLHLLTLQFMMYIISTSKQKKTQISFLSHKQRISHREMRLSHVNLLWFVLFPSFLSPRNFIRR